MKSRPDSLIRWLELQADERPDALYSRYLFPDREPVELSFAETEARTREFAAAFASRGISKGDVVLVVLPHHEDLMPAYLGAMWLGAIPSFLPSLTAKLDPERYYQNLGALMKTTRPRALLAYEELHEALEGIVPAGPDRPALLDPTEAVPGRRHGDPTPHDTEDIALIQYSSGSTGLQKGAALSHRAVLAEIEGVEELFEYTDRDRFVTWVPLYHDWGLVCVALHAIELGTEFTLISPLHWITQPAIVCEAIDNYRATVYYHPNFAFNFMTRRITDEQMEGLDLSSVRVCCNGAEPCFYESHEMFAERFARWGFRRESLSIVYGMAEVVNSVIAAGAKEPIVVDVVDRGLLQTEKRAQPVGEEHPNLVRMLGVGRGLKGTRFRIVDDELEELPERHVGEVEILSRAAYHGYFHNPEATAKADHDGWYVTGDMGYRVGEILFITGRKSDVIILGGVNIYPQDIEAIVAEHPQVVAGRVAAVGVDDPEMGTQTLLVIVESRSTDPTVLRDIENFIRVEIPMRLGVDVDDVQHAPYQWLIKTSSGKIARSPSLQRLPELRRQEGREEKVHGAV